LLLLYLFRKAVYKADFSDYFPMNYMFSSPCWVGVVVYQWFRFCGLLL